MPKFHFNVFDGRRLDDEEGTEFSDLEAVQRHAQAVAHELMYHRDGMLGQPWPEWRMRVTNDQGQEVFSFHLAS
jgi:hypothetical protein